MALTTIDVCERVRARVAPSAPIRMANLLDFGIELLILPGMERMAREVAKSAERRILQKSYASTAPVAGILDLTAATYNDLLIDTVSDYGELYVTAGTTPIIWAPRRKSMYAALQADVVHASLVGTTIHFKDPSGGALTTYITAVILVANFVPNTYAEVPVVCENLLIDSITTLINEKGGFEYLRKLAEDSVPLAA